MSVEEYSDIYLITNRINTFIGTDNINDSTISEKMGYIKDSKQKHQLKA